MTEQFQTRVLVHAEQSDGRVGVVENSLPVGFAGPPLHHHAFDEAFYVLEGALTVRVNEEIVELGAGQLAFAPGGVAHTLANLSDAPARYLLICTPGGFERYFDRIAAEQAGREPSPDALEDYPETIVVGPQIGAIA
jgi:mannose-6-phosphate isomerase-like protein (cupin superfamily)